MANRFEAMSTRLRLWVLGAAVLLVSLGAQPLPADWVVTAAVVVTMDASRRVVHDGAVAVRGTDIVAVGERDAVLRGHPGARVVDASGGIILPGLVNTHTHVPMVLYRGLADDLALKEWLEGYIFPAESRTVSPEFVRAGARLAALEMIRSGTTTFADMYYFEQDIAAVVRTAGLRAVLGQTVIGVPAPDARTPGEALARAAAFVDAFKGDPLITPAVAPHSMYLLERADLLACRELAARHGVPLLIHLSETEGEVQAARERHGATPVGYLDRIGFWSRPTLAAHGVWLDDDDIAILRRHRVAVSHNPESNMKLASGTAPVPKYVDAGVTVGLGTDGAASNNDLDMFEAMRQAALLHKLTTGDPRTLPAPTVLEMATLGGAQALGLDGTLGSLEPGKRADLIVVDTRHPRLTPMYDPISHLVYAAHGDDVAMTVVNGRVLMEKGRVTSLDEAGVLDDAARLAAGVKAALAAGVSR